MNTDRAQGVYVFQGNTLVVPVRMPDAKIHEPLPLEALQGMDALEPIEIPDIDGNLSISSVDLAPESPIPSQWRKIPLRQVIALMTQGTAPTCSGLTGSIFRAYHIIQWRRESRFCGSCGSPNQDAPQELARLCPVCGRVEYPRIAPAIIVIIINDQGQALLAHNKQFLPGVYSLIAGFNEAGETLESTLTREIREEVGLRVRDIRYVTSQPWPFPYSLMAGFSARYAGGTIQVDGVEIEDARWFDRDRVPDLPGLGSVSRYLINQWLMGNFS
ncbi:MAG: NAD(+) diphosphatase [Treponema sp.]|nr:NAD(+) diphosphatase [Treponema sp.]